MIYLNNAATSWPKPERVYRLADQVLREESGNPGRSDHALSIAARRRIEETRQLLARFFNAPVPGRIVFTLNATDALNLAIKGLILEGLYKGERVHVVTSSMEHNSVVRPLEALRKHGLVYSKLATCPINGANPDDVKAAIRKDTKLVVWGHVSNVSGTVNPIAEIGALCHERNIPFLVDAAQSAGTMPIDVQAMGLGLLAFPGHKGLFGSQGTGGLYIGEGLAPIPLREGGTGSHSEDSVQPEDLPDRYESGTMNVAGIAALGEGVRFLTEQGIENVEKHEADLASRLIDGIRDLPGLKIHGPPGGPYRKGIVSITFDKLAPTEAALILENSFDIAVRPGLHCAPDAHRTLGTLSLGGTLRIGIGYLNTKEDIDRCVEALSIILKGKNA